MRCPTSSTETAPRTTLRTTDVDAARLGVADLFCAHRLDLLRPAEGVQLTMSAARLGGIALVELDYGSTVKIRPELLGSFYLVQIPVLGRASVTQGSDHILSDRRTASVLSPVSPVSMTWGAGAQLIVYLERTLIEVELARTLGRTPDRPLEFTLGLDTGGVAGQSWLRTVQFLWSEVQREGALLDQRLTQEAFGRAVAAQLLQTQPHTYTNAMPAPRAAPRDAVDRAIAHIEGHLHEPLSATLVAQGAGVSARALQDAFRRRLGTTPSAYLREVRLQRARELLLSGTDSTTVTDVAMRVGWRHLGRFSVGYRERFGESPSSTLRR